MSTDSAPALVATARFLGAMEFCPVCILRKGLAGGVESGESSPSEDTIMPTGEQAAQRFEAL